MSLPIYYNEAAAMKPSTLILRWVDFESVINLNAWKIDLRPRDVNVASYDNPYARPVRVATDLVLEGTILNETLDVEVKYITEKMRSQKRVDIVNIDPALTWQPKDKLGGNLGW